MSLSVTRTFLLFGSHDLTWECSLFYYSCPHLFISWVWLSPSQQQTWCFHRSNVSKSCCCRFLVCNRSPITWFTCSSMAFTCGFLMVVVHPPLSNMTFLGHGYCAKHVLMKIWLILALILSGIFGLSNQPVAGSTRVMAFKILLLPNILVTVYGPIRSV